MSVVIKLVHQPACSNVIAEGHRVFQHSPEWCNAVASYLIQEYAKEGVQAEQVNFTCPAGDCLQIQDQWKAV